MPSILLSLLLASSLAWSSSRECDPYLSHEEIFERQINTESQNVDRGLFDYFEYPEIREVLLKGLGDPAFHWMDVGTGLSNAVLESYFSPVLDFYQALKLDLLVEGYSSFNLKWKLIKNKVQRKHKATAISAEDVFSKLYPKKHINPMRQRREKLENLGLYRYLVGLFESLSKEKLGLADLITDLFGAFSYSKNKFEILVKMATLLKPGGQAVIVKTELMILSDPMDDVGKEISQMGFNIPGVKFSKDLITIQLQEGTVEGLKRLRDSLEFYRATREEYPPKFSYILKR